MLHFLTLFKVATQKLALKSRIICFSTSSPRSLTSPDGSVRELEPRSRLRWSCGAGVASSECPASADVYQPNDFREDPTHNTHNRMTDESQKNSSAGLEVRTGAAEPAGSEPGVRTGSRSSWTTRYITVTTRENTSLINCD